MDLGYNIGLCWNVKKNSIRNKLLWYLKIFASSQLCSKCECKNKYIKI